MLSCEHFCEPMSRANKFQIFCTSNQFCAVSASATKESGIVRGVGGDVVLVVVVVCNRNFLEVEIQAVEVCFATRRSW